MKRTALTSRTRRASLATAAALALVAIGAGPASASQVWMDPGVDRLVAGGGGFNDVTVDILGPSSVKFTDLDGISQTDCQVLSANAVLCNQPFSLINVSVGSFEDYVTVNANGHKKRILVDSGKDADEVTVTGSPASETINSGLGEDVVTGSDAPSYITSGPLFAGGSDADVVQAGNGGGTINGGDDGDTLQGGSGNDTVYGDDGNDTIHLYGGNDKAWGGIGGDAMYAGAGVDELRGQDGADTLDVLDGIADTTAHCGPGLGDVVLRDNPLDNPAIAGGNCETVQ